MFETIEYVAKTTSINIRITPDFRADMEALADYHGLKMSSMAHSLLVKAIRQAKADMPEVFLKDERPAVVVGNDGILNADEKTATAKKRRVK